jgi:hypothetical protein
LGTPATVKDRIATTVAASGTTVTDIYGVGPIVAALVIGHTGRGAVRQPG